MQITTKITAQDTGGSGLKNLQYQFSSSNTIPSDNDTNWKNFSSGNTITENKAGGIWYLYTKVTDNAGNRATHIQKSNPYIVNYSVTYDANGGTGSMPIDTVSYGSSYTTRANAFTRTGYDFVGWNESPDGTGTDWTSYIGKPLNWSYNKSITLYAQWRINQYTLTVNPNGGTWNGTTGNSTFTQNYGSTKSIANPTAPAGYTVTFDGNGGSTPAAQNSTKSFTSWSNSGSGTLSGTTYTFGAGNGTLTANYKNNSITLPTSTRTGYTFAGWYDAASGGNKIGDAGAAYTPTAAKTLYAHWTDSQYTLTVNPNGGTWNGTTGNSTFTQNYGSTKVIANPTAPAGYKVTFNGNGGSTPAAQNSTKSFTSWSNSGAGTLSGTTYTFGAGNGTLTANYKNNSITLPTSTRTGYTFAGWYDAASGGNKIGDAGATYTPTAAKTLYAHWTVNQYTLTVNPNGGTWNGTTGNSTFTQNYGSTKVIANPTAPAGYTVTFNGNGGSTPAAQNSTKSFTSWSNSGAGSLSGTTYTFGAGNGTLTANYKNNSITLPTSTRTGYTFAGWYDAASGGNKIGDAGATYTPTAAKTLYAHWTINSYTLTVNPNGGTWNGTTGNSTFTQNYGSTKSIANPTAPAGYTVTFDGNGGSTPAAQNSTKSFTSWSNSGSGTLSGTTYTFGAGNGTLTANYKNNSITLPTSTRTGYTFAGWYDAASGGNKIGDAGATYTPTAAKTLYAHWTINSYTLTVNPNGGTWNGTTGNSTFTQNYGSTKSIANPTAPAGYTVTFDGNGGSTPAAQNSTKSFTSWSNSGAGSLSGTTYTFGAGNGTLTANYKNNSITLPTSTRTGYTFAGWYDAASGGNKIGDAGATYTPTAAKTLYAHWNVNSYTLTVNPNGGTWNGTTGNSTFTQNYGSTKVIANPTAPAGYKVTFNGNGGSTPAAQNSTKSFTSWSNSGAGSLSGTTYTFGAGNGTLTANYKNNSITLPTSTRTGYTFAGWYDAASGGNKIGDAGATYTPTAAKTLYAHWTVNQYTLTVNPNGGTWNGTTGNSTFTQNYGSTKSIANPTAPAGYTVTFDGNGGSTPAAQNSTKSFTSWSNSGAGSLSGTTYTFGAGNGTLTANYKNNAITLPTPTRTDYTFIGWYDAKSGGNKIGNAEAAYTPTKAITLYARWTINGYYKVGTTYYNDLSKAMTKASELKGTIEVLTNVQNDNTGSAEATNTVTLNLNGHTLQRKNWIGNSAGTLTINGPGTIDCTRTAFGYAIYETGGNLTINDNVTVISTKGAVQAKAGVLNITGGHYWAKSGDAIVYGENAKDTKGYNVNISNAYALAEKRNTYALHVGKPETSKYEGNYKVLLRNVNMGNAILDAAESDIPDNRGTGAKAAILSENSNLFWIDNKSNISSGPHGGNTIDKNNSGLLKITNGSSLYATNSKKFCVYVQAQDSQVNFDSGNGIFFATGAYVATTADGISTTFKATNGTFASTNKATKLYSTGDGKKIGDSTKTVTQTLTFKYLNRDKTFTSGTKSINVVKYVNGAARKP